MLGHGRRVNQDALRESAVVISYPELHQPRLGFRIPCFSVRHGCGSGTEPLDIFTKHRRSDVLCVSSTAVEVAELELENAKLLVALLKRLYMMPLYRQGFTGKAESHVPRTNFNQFLLSRAKLRSKK